MNISGASRSETWQSALEAELRDCFAGREGFLYNLLRYQLGWVDQEGQPEPERPRESFHALLALAAGEAVGGDYGPALPAAAAVELVYNFALVHNKVQAGWAGQRDAAARPSIWWIWGPAQAINAGDGLHALGRAAMLSLGDRGLDAEGALAAVELLDRACLALCEGQYMDLQFQERLLVTIPEYRDMIGRKTGALTGCAAAAGALAVEGDAAVAARFREWGGKLGMAWQISQDIADFWGERGDGMTASNVLNKKKSLPLLYTLEVGSTAAKRELGGIYMKRVLEPADMGRVVEIMEEVEARAYAERAAGELVEEARAELDADGMGIAAERQEGLKLLEGRALDGVVAAGLHKVEELD